MITGNRKSFAATTTAKAPIQEQNRAPAGGANLAGRRHDDAKSAIRRNAVADWLVQQPGAVASEGRKLYALGAVSPVEIKDHEQSLAAAASVEQIEVHDCEIEMPRPGDISASCSCDSAGTCAHLYATGFALLHDLHRRGLRSLPGPTDHAKRLLKLVPAREPAARPPRTRSKSAEVTAPVLHAKLVVGFERYQGTQIVSASHPGNGMLSVELLAVTPDNVPAAYYGQTGWTPLPKGALARATPALRERALSSLQPATARLMELLQIVWRPAHPKGPRWTTWCESEGDAERVTHWLAEWPSTVAKELGPEIAGLSAAPLEASYSLDLEPAGVGSGIDWFDVRVTLRAKDIALTPDELELLRRAQGRPVHLPRLGWQRMKVVEAAATRVSVAALGFDLDSAETADSTLRCHAAQLAQAPVQALLSADRWQQLQERAASWRAFTPPEVPVTLNAELRPYQREGFVFLCHLAQNRLGGILADDMGLGKTIQAQAWLLWLAALRPAGRPLRALIVCPKSVIVNWQLETARFAPSLTTAALTSGLTALPEVHLLVANYAQIRINSTLLASLEWDAVVVDEAQAIKNSDSANAIAVRSLRAVHRLALSGTPVENRLQDLWSIYEFAMPGLLGSKADFNRLFNGKGDSQGARDRLAARVRHFQLRRTKAQVAPELPARVEEDVICELSPVQRRLYDAELKRARQALSGIATEAQFGLQRFHVLQSLMRLRQICCDPRLIGYEEADGRAPESSAKLEALWDLLEPIIAEGHKVLVFSQFVSLLELVEQDLQARNIEYLLLTGQTERRQELIDRFQQDPSVPVFLLSLKAGGVGLNLTAASYVVLLDPWWNPAVEAQAIDRTHRIGQKDQVIAYRLIARDTIEEKIRVMQREKSALATSVVKEDSLDQVLDLTRLRHLLGEASDLGASK